MARGLCFRAIFNSNSYCRKPIAILANIQSHNLHTKPEVPTKEIQIPIQYGHIAAKLWGSDQDRPILALHGWQDNAGTWDTLAPMLCKNRSILAIDFPGHGFSSRIPAGMHYYTWELPRLILYLKNYFKWDKVSLLSHSMGSIGSLRFGSVFPDEVDCYVAVDSLIYDDFDLNPLVERYPTILRKIEIAQTRLDEEPPSYPMEELEKIWHLSTKKSVALESVKYLIKRGAKPSAKDPTKYYFSRDSRLKQALFQPENKKFVEALVRRLKCPTLYIKAIDSPYASDEFSIEMREVIAGNNENYEIHFVPGTHHVHLNNPERLAPLIEQFMKKHNLRI
ncbi:probable serine hydrolase [Ostrinia nubilalis]|uniref:probable serine hydrolase n=1 Tax=Ostrinia nubilalis TaxID=29057 RepID=UPI0030822BAC